MSQLTKEQAAQVIETADETRDGIFVCVEQGRTVYDTWAASVGEEVVFVVEEYKYRAEGYPVSSFKTVGNFPNVKEYDANAVWYFDNEGEMFAKLSELTIAASHYG